MPQLRVARILKTRLSDHPAVRAWSELRGEAAVPEHVAVLKDEPKSYACRLPGLGRNGSSIIAKRCRPETAQVERSIYEEILPQLSVAALRYYGTLNEPDRPSCWLFLEDAEGTAVSWEDAEHRELAAEWVAAMHVEAASVAAAAKLPDRGPAHYLDHLRLARDNILPFADDPALCASDRANLCQVVAALDRTESSWERLESLCAGMPRTLVHGDFDKTNLRVRVDGQGPSLLVYDWETSGWGIPAPDVIHVDSAVYRSRVRDTWPDVDDGDHWWSVGRLLRGAIAPISWRSHFLPHDWAIRDLELFHGILREAMPAAGVGSVR